MKGWKVEYNECEWIVCVAPDAVAAVALAEEEYTRFVGMTPEQMCYQNNGDYELTVTTVPELDGMETFTEGDLWDYGLIARHDGDDPDTKPMAVVFLTTEG